ncbi:ATP-binding protein [Amycolatopsis magusensis]|uniref:ATP-binding protein n=1 Tax=Amycolatopsis magusensis TaxID=882444 RepID=UPI003C302839
MTTPRGSTAFSRELAKLLRQRRMSWRRLADHVGYTPSWLSKVKNGSPPSADLARRCDEVLEASGRLVALASKEAEGAGVRPAQLPAVTASFAGRDEELTTLTEALSAPGLPGTPRVVLIDGPPGVGKTALALRCAHDLADRFPDGQLFADLRGFTPEAEPVQPAEVLEEFLLAMSLSAQSIPAGVRQRSALYRSLVSDQRILIVLDNAAEFEQIEPLLPGSGRCGVLITSRVDMRALRIRLGARRVVAGPLSGREALDLLAAVIGTEELAEQTKAAEELVERCAHLPLALRIAAERVLTSASEHRIAEVAAQLAHSGLDLLTADRTTAIRAVFAWSYQALSEDAACLFRLLGLHPGPQLGTGAAAALGDLPLERTKTLLRELVEAHLLEQSGEGCYRMHDLLRQYSNERGNRDDVASERADAVHRLLRWYVHSAVAATRAMAPYRDLTSPNTPAGIATTPLSFADTNAAVHWCDIELQNITPIGRLAIDHGATDIAWQLPLALFDYLLMRKPWSIWLSSHEVALKAAETSQDRRAQCRIRIHLAVAHFWLRNLDRSRQLCLDGLEMSLQLEDRYGQACAHSGLARIYCEHGLDADAHEHVQRAITLFEELQEPDGHAGALATLGEIYRRTGRCETALSTTTRALRMCEQQRNNTARGRKMIKVAEVHQARGDLKTALHYLGLSLELRREAGDRWGEADAQLRRGDLLHELGHADLAHQAWTIALEIFEPLDDPRAEDAASRLKAVP